MKMYLRLALMLLSVFFADFKSMAQSSPEKSEAKVVKSLIPDLMVYEASKGDYFPFLHAEHYKAKTVSFFVNVDHYKDCSLRINTKDKISLFINNQLYQSFSHKGEILFDLSSIEAKGQIFISIYGLSNVSSLTSLELVFFSPPSSYARASQKEILSKIHDPYMNVVIMIVVFILFFYALIRLNESKIFSWYFDLGKIISNTTVDLNIISGSMNGSALLLAMLNALVLGFAFALYMVDHNVMWSWFGDMSKGSILMLTIILVSVIVFAGIVLKFFFLRIIGGMLGAKNIVKLHFFEFNRLLTLISMVILPLAILSFYGGEKAGNLAGYVVVIVFLVAMLRIITVINRESSFRIIYLFSYICTTEIIPVLILAKYFGFGHV